ncbi:MAG: ATP-binding protein [Cyanobacteriota bacterium]|nr:ATP-binding protein [Cyanobacteriota bacterium]
MGRARILIVEDESIVALNIKNRLEGLGYAVVATSSSGEAAIQIVAQSLPDLVLMDIKLKGTIDGIEAAAQIRAHFQIPVVYLTAFSDEETVERVKLTEPYGYILKPFEARDLCTTIEISLYKHQMEQQLREREQWLATTLKSIGDAVITTDSEGLVTFMNPVAETLTCWKQEEVLGNDLTQIFQTINEKTREVVENPATLALRQGVTVGLENHTLLITKNGTEIPIDDSAAPIKNDAGNILGAVLIFHDITEQQQVKAFLERTNEELESRVAENTAQLRETNEQLRAEIAQRQRLENELLMTLEKERELNELKSRILATISHEYRTPLTTILSSTDLLAQYSSRWTDERKQKHFQRIQSAVKQLTNLVNDVLFVNQAEVGSLEFNPEPLAVEQVARRLVEEFQSNATYQHTIIFECQGSSTNALLDEKLIEAMLRNLLFNAIKYSPKGSLIQFELVFQQNTVVFRISDQGIGIPPADQGSLFTAFFRGSNVGTTPGVGLGLVIVKECVDLHAGEIVVESEVKVGTRFTVTLPLAQRLTSD